jgi:hypothetical protein
MVQNDFKTGAIAGFTSLIERPCIIDKAQDTERERRATVAYFLSLAADAAKISKFNLITATTARRRVPSRPVSTTATPLPRAIFREDIISLRHYRVAREPAFCVVCLRWAVRFVACPKSLGRRIILELSVAPPAAVSKPLAALHHEIDIVLDARHYRLARIRFFIFKMAAANKLV